MKLVFICTSLAPGRDGVGDYVRQLAAACTAAGHTCQLVAVNDRALPADSPTVENENEIRWSASLPWPRRIEAWKRLVEDFDPDWISWQIVPYGFHAKGVMPPEAFQLIDAIRDRRQHLMLHELWIGVAQGEPLRARLIGAWQRRQLLAFIRRLRPARVHTSNTAYQQLLARRGWRAEQLPLFGNIPIMPPEPQDTARHLADLAGNRLPSEPRSLGVIFGTVHPQWHPDATFQWLRAAAEHAARRVAIVALGRIGAHGETLVAQLAERFPEIPVIVAGAQSPERVSQLLQAADFGIATHPWDLIEKSGSTATMLEHGLPVLVPRDEWHLRDGAPLPSPLDPLLTRLSDLPPTGFASWLEKRRAPAPRLVAVAHQFLTDLGEPVRRTALLT